MYLFSNIFLNYIENYLFGFFFRGKVSSSDIRGINSLYSMSHKDYVTFYIVEQPRPQSNF